MRQSYFAFLFFVFVLISCKKEQVQEPVTIYNFEDFDNKIIIKDTLCESETKRANEDIKKGLRILNVSYLYTHRINKINSFSEKEREHKISEHLKKYHIQLDTLWMITSDLIGPCDGLFRKYCYEKTMKEKIAGKHGNLIDSLLIIVEREYVIENPDKIYDSSDIDSRHYNLSGKKFTDFNDRMRLNFEAAFNYPPDYKPKVERSFSYTSADFILMKDGTVNNINAVATFQNPENEKFRAYFENEVSEFVKKTNWRTATIHGIPVNTEMTFTFFHK